MKQKTLKEVKKYGFVLSVMAYPAILFCIFYIFVNINSIAMAFGKIDANGHKTFNGFNNFAAFIDAVKNDVIVSTSIINSVKIFFINLVICVPLYLIFSYYIFKKFFGTAVFRSLIMIPTIVSSFIVCMLFKKFVELALPNIMLGLGVKGFPNLLRDPRYTFGTIIFYMIWISFSTSLVVYPNAMREIPTSVIESAQLDGVNYIQEFRYIVVPLIYPTISTFLITGVSAIFSNSGPVLAFYMYDAYPEVYNFGYYILVKVMNSNETMYPMLSAGGILITLLIAPITYLVRYLLEKFGPEAEYC